MAEAIQQELDRLMRQTAVQRGLEPAEKVDDKDFDLQQFVENLTDLVTKGRTLRIAVTAFFASLSVVLSQLGIEWFKPSAEVAPQQIAAAVAAYESGPGRDVRLPGHAAGAFPGLPAAFNSPAPPSDPATSEPTAVAGPRLPASLEIDGPAAALPGDLIVLEATGDSDAVRWFLGNSSKTFLPVDGGKRVVFASGTPGEYRFFAVGATIDAGKISLDDDTHTVVIGAPGPVPVPPSPTPPTPTPTPVPPSPPAPQVKVTGLLAAVVLRDAVTVTADQSQVIVDLREWADKQDASKAALYVFDDDAEEPHAATYRKAVPVSAELPYSFLVDFGTQPKATILWQGELPPKATDLIQRAEALLQ